MLNFDLTQPPSTPRDAATVIVVRDRAGSAEVLAVIRHAKSGFLGGALVFPGGKVDEADRESRWGHRSTGVEARAETFASETASALALAVAACREAIEEAGVCPIDPPASGARIGELRTEVEARGLFESLVAAGARLDTLRLVPFARWITPEAESRRFDARFFLLELPEGQEGRHDDRETTLSFWDRPASILARADKGEFFLAPPTARSLELLAEARTAREARSIGARQSLLPIRPVFVPGDAPYLALPGDPSHAVRELHVDGPTRYVLREGRFHAEHAPVVASRERSR